MTKLIHLHNQATIHNIQPNNLKNQTLGSWLTTTAACYRIGAPTARLGSCRFGGNCLIFPALGESITNSK